MPGRPLKRRKLRITNGAVVLVVRVQRCPDLCSGRLGDPSLPKDRGPICDLVRQRGLGGGETRDGDAKWTATNVVQPQAVTEFY